MSAHIVSKGHIDYLVAAALFGPQGHHPNWSAYFFNPETSKTFDPREDPDALGRMVWAENYASVAYRYQDSAADGLPGPSDFDVAEVYAYSFGGHRTPDQPPAVAILKAIDGLEYQS